MAAQLYLPGARLMLALVPRQGLAESVRHGGAPGIARRGAAGLAQALKMFESSLASRRSSGLELKNTSTLPPWRSCLSQNGDSTTIEFIVCTRIFKYANSRSFLASPNQCDPGASLSETIGIQSLTRPLTRPFKEP